MSTRLYPVGVWHTLPFTSVLNDPDDAVPLGIFYRAKKLGSCHTRGWKEFDNMCFRLDTILERDRRTDGFTEKNIAVCTQRVLTRDKNEQFLSILTAIFQMDLG